MCQTIQFVTIESNHCRMYMVTHEKTSDVMALKDSRQEVIFQHTAANLRQK